MATAQQEILRRIKSLDFEESNLRRRAGNMRAEAARADAEAEALAVLRRQYEFAFVQLGGEFPQPASAVAVPVNRGGRLIGTLG